MSQFKEDIRSFILSLQEKAGRLPKFCHNLNAAENKIYYSGAFFDENELVAAIDTLLLANGHLVEKYALNLRFNLVNTLIRNTPILLIPALQQTFY